MITIKSNRIFRRFAALLTALLLCVFTAGAQSSGDKYYNQGLQAQKTMTIASQNSAISYFQKAKKVYDSAAKKSQCDQAISVSRGIISQLKTGGGKTGGGGKYVQPRVQQKEAPEKPKTTLSLSNTSFNLGQGSGSMEVTVTTNASDWRVDEVANSDGSSFVKVKKNGEDSFIVSVPYNDSSTPRTQYVQVTAGDSKELMTVSQAGREITLKADATAVEAKRKGDKKKITVSCNGSQTYPDNYNLNWHVAECPDWITIAPKEKKDNLLSKGLKWGKKQVESYGIELGEGDEDNIPKSQVELIIDPITSGSSRKAEVVLESGYKQYRFTVNQYK